MAMQVGGSGSDDEDHVVSAINTTPLVDVMLVLLIIFLITIPAATHTVKIQLPKEMNRATVSKQGNIVLAITANGQIFWNEAPVNSMEALQTRLHEIATKKPLPQIQIRGDMQARYETVGKVVAACNAAGIERIDFVTERPKQ